MKSHLQIENIILLRNREDLSMKKYKVTGVNNFKGSWSNARTMEKTLPLRMTFLQSANNLHHLKK